MLWTSRPLFQKSKPSSKFRSKLSVRLQNKYIDLLFTRYLWNYLHLALFLSYSSINIYLSIYSLFLHVYYVLYQCIQNKIQIPHPGYFSDLTSSYPPPFLLCFSYSGICLLPWIHSLPLPQGFVQAVSVWTFPPLSFHPHPKFFCPGWFCLSEVSQLNDPFS